MIGEKKISRPERVKKVFIILRKKYLHFPLFLPLCGPDCFWIRMTEKMWFLTGPLEFILNAVDSYLRFFTSFFLQIVEMRFGNIFFIISKINSIDKRYVRRLYFGTCFIVSLIAESNWCNKSYKRTSTKFSLIVQSYD